MRTVLSQFCDEFEQIVRPLIPPMQSALTSLGGASEHLAAREILPGLRDTGHQLQTLADKVAEQQAYVLIFGPLKSGKSTLMNAVCAAYVSEVTTLPAYPCMVYVAHADPRELKITRYNGQTDSFADLAALRMAMTRAHTELADRIREVEATGENFDPALHHPEAIRRVDVKVPAGQLAESGAVLVDTPGLYTRMKFGYDRMTREFRDSAACAIFVVKTDNLFLEQVFTEFNQLLELFSRIFLVVNLDTSKKDLRPDGSLAPSLEHDDPIRIIEAFENLAMGAQLKKALDDRRLRIYPVDLQRAASLRLRQGDSEGADAAEPAGTHQDRQADFDAFVGDLTDYLNSTDYLHAFLSDSLRHATALLEDSQELCQRESVRALADQVRTLEQDLELEQAQARRIKRITDFDWEQAFTGLRTALLEDVAEHAERSEGRTGQAVNGALDDWFRSDASLKTLLEGDVAGLMASSQRELGLAAQEALKGRASEEAVGAEIPPDIRLAVRGTGVRLDEIGRHALSYIAPADNVSVRAPEFDPHDIPVRKRLVDWLLFRGQGAIRRRLFGPADRPAQRIAPAVKAKRLGEAGREVMREMLEDHVQSTFPETSNAAVSKVYQDYAGQCITALNGEVETRRAKNHVRLKELGAELQGLAQVRGALATVEEQAAAALLSVSQLSARSETTDPAMLKEPLEADEAHEEAAVAAEMEPLAAADDEIVAASGDEPEIIIL